MVKMPKKEVGKVITHEGYELTCKDTGKSWKGVPSTAWYHSNGEQAMRSVNGVITFIEPSDNVTTHTNTIPQISFEITKKYEAKALEEQYVYALAWNIAKKRHPDMNEKLDVYGMIVNSIVTRLLTI